MAKVTRIHVHHEPEGWWADSPDLPGFSAAGSTAAELSDLVEEASILHGFKPYALVSGVAPTSITIGTN